jgi:iron complex outermembrane receptor protein
MTSGIVVLLLLPLLFPASALAQTGTIFGVVLDGPTGDGLFAANVQVTSQRDNSVQITRLSGQDGTFEVEDLSPGPYEIRISFVGYQTLVQADVDVKAGETTRVTLALTGELAAMETVVVTASRRQEKLLDAPASVSVVSGEAVQERTTLTVADHLQGTPGVDIQRAGINQGTVVVRGFNNIFSGATLTLVDNRIANIPSLRYNALNLIPTTNEDIAQIEIVSGPGSALYGPNTANGVLHMVTRPPFGSEEIQASVAGGNRDIFLLSGRYAGSAKDRIGWKVSGQAYRAYDFEYEDPAEQAARDRWEQENPGVPTKIAERDFNTKKVAVEGRVDFLPSEHTTLIVNGGWNRLDAIELTGLGAAQAKDWASGFGQARFSWKDLFVQAYVNASDAGETYNLRTGADFKDQSRFTVAQIQHQARLREKHRFTYGLDAMFTRPDTKGTIMGRNEDSDDIDEVGGYLQWEWALARQWDFVAAGRVDSHNKLDDPVFSPRAAIVWGPTEQQKLRATYNRAFSTPTTNNLFLDLVTLEDLGGFGAATGFQGYDLRASGVPDGGFTFARDSATGLGGLYMQMPDALRVLNGMPPGSDFLAAEATQTWGAVQQILLAQGTDITAIPAPPSVAVGTVLRSLNPTTGGFDLIQPSQVQDVPEMKPTITNTIELGWKGELSGGLSGSVDVYYSKIEDFVGPLRVETPNVFFDPATLGAYLSNPLFGLSAAQIQGLTAAIAGIPVGTVTPSNGRDPADLILTYRNFGNVELGGLDLGVQWQFDPVWTLTASYSHVSEDLFENLDGIGDVALNAPKNKVGLGLRYHDRLAGLNTGFRILWVDGFPVSSGVYVGEVQPYTVTDFDIEYQIPRLAGTSVVLTMQNVFDHLHREFVGTPELGRVSMLRLNQRF